VDARDPLPLDETFTFIAACPLGAVRHFVIGGRKVQEEVTGDRVSRTMRNLRSVETLVLQNTPHLLPLLLPAIQGDQPPCPTLKTLVIEDDRETLHQELVQVVKARAEAGFPLKRVILSAEYFEEVAGELRQFVEDVGCEEDAEYEFQF